MFGEQLLHEQNQRLFIVKTAPLFIHKRRAIAIAVERNAQIRLNLDHLLTERAQMRMLRRIGIAIRKRAVRFAEQLRYAISRIAKCGGGDRAHRAVACVDDHLQRLFRAESLRKRSQIRRQYVQTRNAARTFDKRAAHDDILQRVDRSPRRRFMTEHEFDSIVFRRIVGSGDRRARVRGSTGERIIQRRRGDYAQIRDPRATLDKTGNQIFLEIRRGKTHVAAHANFTARRQHRCQPTTDAVNAFFVDFRAVNAANIAVLEYAHRVPPE